jgi:hypothetical protein
MQIKSVRAKAHLIEFSSLRRAIPWGRGGDPLPPTSPLIVSTPMKPETSTGPSKLSQFGPHYNGNNVAGSD